MVGRERPAIAYNVSSASTFPSLRYTGRLADDPLSTMTQGEISIVAGSGSNSSNRYGDYSAMNLDPADDCTFWFTGEYNTSGNWSTRIASFRFDACGCDLFPLPLGISGGVGGPNQGMMQSHSLEGRPGDPGLRRGMDYERRIGTDSDANLELSTFLSSSTTWIRIEDPFTLSTGRCLEQFYTSRSGIARRWGQPGLRTVRAIG